MSLDAQLGRARLYHRSIEETAFQNCSEVKLQILATIAANGGTVQRRGRWMDALRQKRMSLVLVAILLPLAGFTAYHFYEKWMGTHVASTAQKEGAVSFWADPQYLMYELGQPGVKTFAWDQSVHMAGIPLQKPIQVAGWTKILSEGITFSQKGYLLLPDHKMTLDHIGRTPLLYVTVYRNARGERISITQQIQPMMSAAYRQERPGARMTEIQPTIQVGANWISMAQSPDSLVYWVSGRWSRLPGKTPFHGEYENIVAFQKAPGHFIKETCLDAYGGVGKSQMLAFAKGYLGPFQKRKGT